MSNEIPTTTSHPFRAAEIVYNRYRYTISSNGKFKLIPKAFGYVIHRTDIDKFLKDLAKKPDWSHYDKKYSRPPASEDPDPGTPLDVLVQKQCYVVMELDRNQDWQFTREGPGLIGKDNYGDANFRLMHVDANGVAFDPTMTNPPASRILCFCVAYREPYQHHKFDMFVELLQDADQPPLRVAIDPDVPESGGEEIPIFLEGKKK